MSQKRRLVILSHVVLFPYIALTTSVDLILSWRSRIRDRYMQEDYVESVSAGAGAQAGASIEGYRFLIVPTLWNAPAPGSMTSAAENETMVRAQEIVTG